MTLMDLLFSAEFLDTAPDAFYNFFPVFVLFGVLGILLLVGVPIAFAIGIAALFTVFIDFPVEHVTILVSQKLANGLDNFGLLALPFFIVAGNLMNRGGLASRLINFVMIFGGRLPGALSHVNVMANMLFGSLSGSATASAAAVGGIMKPLQEERKYPMDFSTAVNVASCPSDLASGGLDAEGLLVLNGLIRLSGAWRCGGGGCGSMARWWLQVHHGGAGAGAVNDGGVALTLQHLLALHALPHPRAVTHVVVEVHLRGKHVHVSLTGVGNSRRIHTGCHALLHTRNNGLKFTMQACKIE